MSKTYRLYASQLAIAILLSIVCVDLTSCWMLLKINDTSKILIWDAISVSLKVGFLLLSIYRAQFWQGTDHTKGLIGHGVEKQKSQFAHKLTIMVIHSLICFMSLLRICFLTTCWQVSVLAVASCMMGLSLGVLDAGLASKSFNYNRLDNPGNGEDARSKFELRKIVRAVHAIILATPAVCLDIAGWSMLCAGWRHHCGTDIKQEQVIEILCLQGVSFITSIICIAMRWPARPYPAYGPTMSRYMLLLQLVPLYCFSMCHWNFKCSHLLIIAMAIAHVVTLGLVLTALHVRKYEDSEHQLKVVKAKWWGDLIVITCTAVIFTIAIHDQVIQNDPILKAFIRMCRLDSVFKAITDMDQPEKPANNLDPIEAGYTKTSYWISIVPTSVLIAFHLLYLGRNTIILEIQDVVRRAYVESGKELSKHVPLIISKMGKYFLEIQFPYPIIYLPLVFVYQGTVVSKNCPSIAVSILLIILMCFSGQTNDNTYKKVATNADVEAQELQFLNLDTDTPHPQATRRGSRRSQTTQP